jgi:hypothetical protein
MDTDQLGPAAPEPHPRIQRIMAHAGRVCRSRYQDGGNAPYTTRKLAGAVAFKDSGLSEEGRVLQ